jgi:argininosuccinate lyase
MKMWSGRFRRPLDPDFERWQRSFSFDRRLLVYELAASDAHARALKNAGILSADELISILQGLHQIGERATESPAFLYDSEAEDVHHFVEMQLVASIGETGYKLHSGRSRNEQIATDLRLYVRATIDQLRHELADLCGVLVDRAEQAGDAAMPAYTHLQRAEPVLIGHWLLAYVEMLLRDAGRLVDCRKRLNLCPLGSGAVAGATLSLDRAFMAGSLGFGPASEPLGRRDDSVFLAGVWIPRSAGSLFDRQQRNAPEEKSRSARVGARQEWTRVGECYRSYGCSQGVATGLQQRPAGNAGTFDRLFRHSFADGAVGDRIHEGGGLSS